MIRAGELIATTARTGSAGDESAFRINNLLLRGSEDGKRYWETFSGLGNLGQNIPMSVMTGTLALTANSNEVVGTGTLFLTECPYIGMRISCIPADNSDNHFIVVQRVIDNTHMKVWVPPHGNPPWPTVSELIGWRMPRAYAVNDQLGVSTWGNVLKLDRGSFLGAGLGTFYLDGSQLGGTSFPLTRQPTIALYDPATNTYTVFPLGMDTSAPPTLAAVGGGSKMQGGNYSMVITPARKETGGYNNPSDRADVTIVTNDRIAVTFPPMDTANGQNAWIPWVTTFTDTLGADLNYLNGPWKRLRLIDDTEVSPAGGTVNIEYYDAEVENNINVAFNNDAPTDAMGVELMNAIPVWTSCQGQGFVTNPAATSPGPFICPAKPNNIEAAPLEIAFSSSPPETIIGTTTAQGRIYLLTPNKLQIAQSTPSDIVPILIRPFWHTGFATWEQIVFVDGVLYGYPVSGPVRSAGEGDESYVQHDWGAKVYEITRNWNPGQVLVGYDPRNDAVILFHIADSLNSAGFWTTKWLAYGIALQRWLGGGVFTSNTKDQIVCGLATVNDDLLLLTSGRE